ncbi:hypothetical protein BDA96_04G176100 [Sorghum bicolor]|uniref:Uncharacterized protein n=1 Tax=Sorghum bicolor TaxID=4558 RepID=A0A921R3F5_SORBI|nr:hypothetical protein BDA96_04G176100 [Sorghum bicolor]
MGEGRAKAQALLLAALVLMMSCSAAASPSNCIPRRLLMASGSYYRRAPCNDDLIGRRPTPNDGHEEISGSRTPRVGPPSPTWGTTRAAGTSRPTPPGIIN